MIAWDLERTHTLTRISPKFYLIPDDQLNKFINSWDKHNQIEIALALEVREYRKAYGPLMPGNLNGQWLSVDRSSNVGPSNTSKA